MIRLSIEEGFSVGYNDVLAQAHHGFELRDGTHYLLARNGRGKTTLMRTLSGLLAPKSGSFTVSGSMQFVPEDISYSGFMTARQVLKPLVAGSRWSECVAMAENLELDIDKLYRSLSTGNQRKVSWLMAEFSFEKGGQQVLLLDEPFTGLDSHAREVIMSYWGDSEDELCRLVSCHPDFDSMSIKSALLISDNELKLLNDDAATSWGELKVQLK